MKRVFALCLMMVLTLAATAMASGTEPVLTSDGVLYTVAADEAQRSLVVTARYNTTKQSLVVPGTVDGVLDTDGRLLYDRYTETLYVVWRRGENSSEVVFQSLNERGEWSPLTTLGSTPGYRQSGLRVALTRTISAQNEPVTVLNAIWWKESTSVLIGEYAMAAVSGATVHSTAVADLEQLTGIRSMLDTGATSEDGLTPRPELVPTYPPFAISASKDAVDVVFGAKDKKTVTRIRVEPRQPRPDARLWIPVGKNATRSPYTRVHNAITGQVETHISGDSVVIYAAAAQFRYAMIERGIWSPVRAIALDSTITPAEIVSQIRRNLEEQQ
jgi:hypothetical protein